MFVKRRNEVKEILKSNKIPFKRLVAIGYSHRPMINFISLAEYTPVLKKLFPSHHIETVEITSSNPSIVTSTKPVVEFFIKTIGT